MSIFRAAVSVYRAAASAKPLWMFLPVYQAAKRVSGAWTVLLLLGPPALLIAIPFLPRRFALGAGLLLLVAAVVFGILGAAA